MNIARKVSPASPVKPPHNAGEANHQRAGIGATARPCDECEGTGFFTSGAFHPDDPRCEATWDCETCDGTGEVEDEPCCLTCEGPLRPDGFCMSCDDFGSLIFVARDLGSEVVL